MARKTETDDDRISERPGSLPLSDRARLASLSRVVRISGKRSVGRVAEGMCILQFIPSNWSFVNSPANCRMEGGSGDCVHATSP